MISLFRPRLNTVSLTWVTAKILVCLQYKGYAVNLVVKK